MGARVSLASLPHSRGRPRPRRQQRQQSGGTTAAARMARGRPGRGAQASRFAPRASPMRYHQDTAAQQVEGGGGIGGLAYGRSLS